MEFNGLMEKTFKNEFFSEVREEQEYRIKNIEIKEGIAKNDALKENLFTICMYNYRSSSFYIWKTKGVVNL